ncbi:hypothetical protein Tco_0114657, partial [Tanacetum coccineum]
MFDKEKLSGNNFNDWFARFKLVLRVEKKMHVIKHPLPPAPEPVAEPEIVAQWTALYDAHTEIACLMLGSMTPELHRQFEINYNMHNMRKTIGEIHAMFIEYEKGLPKKAETPQVMMIKGGRIKKVNKKSLKAKGKGKDNVKGKDNKVYIPKPISMERPTKDD